jgi:hypothetical protein
VCPANFNESLLCLILRILLKKICIDLHFFFFFWDSQFRFWLSWFCNKQITTTSFLVFSTLYMIIISYYLMVKTAVGSVLLSNLHTNVCDSQLNYVDTSSYNYLFGQLFFKKNYFMVTYTVFQFVPFEIIMLMTKISASDIMKWRYEVKCHPPYRCIWPHPGTVTVSYLYDN